MHRTSQRPHIDFHVSVMATHAGLDLPAYITTLLFSGLTPFMSRLGLRLFTASQQEEFTVLTHIHIYIFKNYSSPRNNREAVIRIYIRSLDQARGLLAQGVLVLPSAVSSDSQHASSGNLCTPPRIHQLSLSTSKLSGLSLSLSFSLFISFFFISYPSLTLSCGTSTVTVIFPLCAISTALHYLCILYCVCSHISISCQRCNVALKLLRPLGELRVGAHQEPFFLSFACVRNFFFTINLCETFCVYLCVPAACVLVSFLIGA